MYYTYTSIYDSQITRFLIFFFVFTVAVARIKQFANKSS